jgi:hypothetical protein
LLSFQSKPKFNVGSKEEDLYRWNKTTKPFSFHQKKTRREAILIL